MRIIFDETETGTVLELEVNKVDTPTGTGWSVLTPQKKKILIKSANGLWDAEEDANISQEFWQMVGNEIDRQVEVDRRDKEFSAPNPRPKRARILKYLLV